MRSKKREKSSFFDWTHIFKRKHYRDTGSLMEKREDITDLPEYNKAHENIVNYTRITRRGILCISTAVAASAAVMIPSFYYNLVKHQLVERPKNFGNITLKDYLKLNKSKIAKELGFVTNKEYQEWKREQKEEYLLP